MLSHFKSKQKAQRFRIADHYPDDWVSEYTYPLYEYASPQAKAFHESTKQIRGFFGGNRGGKSEVGAVEIVKMARQYPGQLFWACSVSVDFTKIAAGKIFKYLANEEIERIAWSNSARRIPSYIRLKNQSEIEFKTYKSGIESFAGASVKGIWLDEDPELGVMDGEAIFVECLQRTIDCRGRVWITATPVLGRNWMYDRIYRKGADQDKHHRENPNVEHWTVSLLDNKFVGDAEKANAKLNLSEDEIGRRFYGVFTTLSGAVFKEYNPDIHISREMPVIPSSWRHVRSIDLGYENPFCCLWGAMSPDGVLYIYDEYYRRRALIRDHATSIKERTYDQEHLRDIGVESSDIEVSVCDHDRQERAELEAEGVYTIPANKEVDLGIQVCNRAFKHQHIVISSRCYWLCKELLTYHYAQTSKSGKEVVVKVDDHAVDALRYMVMYLMGRGQVNYEILQ